MNKWFFNYKFPQFPIHEHSNKNEPKKTVVWGFFFHLIHHQGNKIFFYSVCTFQILFRSLNKLTKKEMEMKKKWKMREGIGSIIIRAIWVLIPSFSLLSTCYSKKHRKQQTICKWIIVRYVYNIKLHSNPRLISNS